MQRKVVARSFTSKRDFIKPFKVFTSIIKPSPEGLLGKFKLDTKEFRWVKILFAFCWWWKTALGLRKPVEFIRLVLIKEVKF